MTAAEYRKEAERILTDHRRNYDDCVQQAAIWAQLAVSAAISEQSAAAARPVNR